jgi:hypothetical protein
MRHSLLGILAIQFVPVFAALGADTPAPLVWERTRIGDVTFEAASVFDVNNDGKLDIVSGECWFEGPDFSKRHKICVLRQEEDYYDDFSDYPLDVNGDGNGWKDVLAPGKSGLYLFRNMGPLKRTEP